MVRVWKTPHGCGQGQYPVKPCVRVWGKGARGAYDTAQDLRCQQGLYILGREKECRPSVDEHQTHNHGPAIPKSLRDPAVNEETDQLANIGALVRILWSALVRGKRRRVGKP